MVTYADGLLTMAMAVAMTSLCKNEMDDMGVHFRIIMFTITTPSLPSPLDRTIGNERLNLSDENVVVSRAFCGDIIRIYRNHKKL